jgi:hypothetical protein
MSWFVPFLFIAAYCTNRYDIFTHWSIAPMMTIRVSTGQNEHDVCLQALIFAFNTGVTSMRTKWFSISPADGLKWKNLDFADVVLARVMSQLNKGEYIGNRGFVYSVDLPAGFGAYIGVFSYPRIKFYPSSK